MKFRFFTLSVVLFLLSLSLLAFLYFPLQSYTQSLAPRSPYNNDLSSHHHRIAKKGIQSCTCAPFLGPRFKA